jgi:hypothetical protein
MIEYRKKYRGYVMKKLCRSNQTLLSALDGLELHFKKERDHHYVYYEGKRIGWLSNGMLRLFDVGLVDLPSFVYRPTPNSLGHEIIIDDKYFHEPWLRIVIIETVEYLEHQSKE